MIVKMSIGRKHAGVTHEGTGPKAGRQGPKTAQSRDSPGAIFVAPGDQILSHSQ